MELNRQTSKRPYAPVCGASADCWGYTRVTAPFVVLAVLTVLVRMSAHGTKLPKPIGQACPELAKADVAFLVHPCMRRPTDRKLRRLLHGEW